MKSVCPNCRAAIFDGQINATTDVAVCPACNEMFSVPELVDGGYADVDFDLRRGPPGTWFEETGTGWRLGTSSRSYGALFFVPFTCFWLGLSSLMLFVFIWLEPHGVAALCVSPFFLIGLFLLWPCAMSIRGRVVVAVDHGQGIIFTGVGRYGFTKRFDWGAITAVREKLGEGKTWDRAVGIELVGATPVVIRGWMSERRLYYLLRGLRRLLGERNLGRTVLASEPRQADSAVVGAGRPTEEHRIAEQQLAEQEAERFDLRAAPPGAWYEETGVGWRIGASTQSSGVAVQLMVVCVLAGGPPAFFWGPQIAAGRFQLGPFLLGLPFAFIGLLMVLDALMKVWGKVIVTVDGDEGRVFAGIGALGRTRRFVWGTIMSVEKDGLPYRSQSGRRPAIVLNGPTRITLGTMLNEVRFDYLLRGLQKLLAERKRRERPRVRPAS